MSGIPSSSTSDIAGLAQSVERKTLTSLSGVGISCGRGEYSIEFHERSSPTFGVKLFGEKRREERSQTFWTFPLLYRATGVFRFVFDVYEHDSLHITPFCTSFHSQRVAM